MAGTFFAGPALALALLICGAERAAGQDEEGKIATWQRLESAAETRAYKEAVRGGAFDAAARAFLEQTALPQLALEANRPTIERVRKRMRELLLGDIGSEAAADEASRTVLSFMDALAKNADAPPVARVNAMLLVGELQGTDRRPWKPASAVLAREAADPKQSKAVRIAAVVGLVRHVEAAKASAEERQRLAQAARPAILAILGEPTTRENAAENDWLASRCLSMLPLMGPLDPQLAAAVTAILGDAKRSIDVRVRAAAALAAASPEAKVDAGAVIATVRSLAVESLKADIAVAERLQLESDPSLGGVSAPGGPRPPAAPGFAADATQQAAVSLLPSEVGRRAAWRLVTLADAILTDDGKRGIAVVAGGEPPADARVLAQSLRGGAMVLDENPEESAVRQVLADLEPPAPAKDEKAAVAPQRSRLGA